MPTLTGPVKLYCDSCELEELRAQLAAQKKADCLWTEDADGNWSTACHEMFIFDVDGPAKNGMKFCPYCAGNLIEKRYTEPEPEPET